MSKNRATNKKEEEKNNWKELINKNISEMRLDFKRVNVGYTCLNLKNNKITKPIDIINPIILNYKLIKKINWSYNNINDISLCFLISISFTKSNKIKHKM